MAKTKSAGQPKPNAKLDHGKVVDDILRAEALVRIYRNSICPEDGAADSDAIFLLDTVQSLLAQGANSVDGLGLQAAQEVAHG
jgi:hypothetical protein